jgi:hypothetical protein
MFYRSSKKCRSWLLALTILGRLPERMIQYSARELMERAMRALLLTVLMVTSVPLTAEPSRPTPTPHAVQEQRPAILVLASNDTGGGSLNAETQSSAAPRHRIARVTTCRCGDVQPEPDSDSDQQ